MNELIVYQGTKDYFVKELSFDKKVGVLKEKLREFFNLKNVNFLFGSGTSNGAIPTMSELYKRLVFTEDEKELKKAFRCINFHTRQDTSWLRWHLHAETADLRFRQ